MKGCVKFWLPWADSHWQPESSQCCEGLQCPMAVVRNGKRNASAQLSHSIRSIQCQWTCANLHLGQFVVSS